MKWHWVNGCMVVLYTQNVRPDGISFTWRQACNDPTALSVHHFHEYSKKGYKRLQSLIQNHMRQEPKQWVSLFGETRECPGSFACYCGNSLTSGMDTEITVCTERWHWRRQVSHHGCCRDSNPRPFDHERGAVTTELSPFVIWPNQQRRPQEGKKSEVKRI